MKRVLRNIDILLEHPYFWQNFLALAFCLLMLWFTRGAFFFILGLVGLMIGGTYKQILNRPWGYLLPGQRETLFKSIALNGVVLTPLVMFLAYMTTLHYLHLNAIAALLLVGLAVYYLCVYATLRIRLIWGSLLYFVAVMVFIYSWFTVAKTLHDACIDNPELMIALSIPLILLSNLALASEEVFCSLPLQPSVSYGWSQNPGKWRERAIKMAGRKSVKQTRFELLLESICLKKITLIGPAAIKRAFGAIYEEVGGAMLGSLVGFMILFPAMILLPGYLMGTDIASSNEGIKWLASLAVLSAFLISSFGAVTPALTLKPSLFLPFSRRQLYEASIWRCALVLLACSALAILVILLPFVVGYVLPAVTVKGTVYHFIGLHWLVLLIPHVLLAGFVGASLALFLQVLTKNSAWGRMLMILPFFLVMPFGPLGWVIAAGSSAAKMQMALILIGVCVGAWFSVCCLLRKHFLKASLV